MGLALHVHAHLPAELDFAAVCEVVGRWQQKAERFAVDGRVAGVFETSCEADDLNRFAMSWRIVPHPTDRNASTGIEVKPLAGCIFLVQLGAGCEPFVLGLCRYPNVESSVADNNARKNDRWRLVSSCKTQYASNLGWEHFRRCHLAAVDLAAMGAELGIEVRIEDEGNYWPGRDESALRAALDRYNGLVAAMAGMLHDAEDELVEKDSEKSAANASEQTKRPRVQSPIFAHPQFERLEAEGQAGIDAQKLTEALRIIREQSRDESV